MYLLSSSPKALCKFETKGHKISTSKLPESQGICTPLITSNQDNPVFKSKAKQYLI